MVTYKRWCEVYYMYLAAENSLNSFYETHNELSTCTHIH